MNQSELNVAVARITGESIQTIKRLGFFLDESSLKGGEINVDADAQIIDWDQFDLQREWQNQLSNNSEPSYV